MLKDPIANKYWEKLYEWFPGYQFNLIDDATNEIIAIANSLPLRFDDNLIDLPDSGWDWVVEKGMSDYQNEVTPNIQSALSITLSEKYLNKGLSRTVVQEMKNIGILHNLQKLIAPVRPNMKAQFPLMSMDEYIRKTNDDGFPFDPWIRVHKSIGGEIVKVCHRSMYIPGTIDEWESWTNMIFPSSADFVVDGALLPVKIDLENNIGEYIEPNVLMVHELKK